MENFNYYCPTKLVFGKDREKELPALIKQAGGKKVLIHYGGGSAVASGLLGKIEGCLTETNIPFVKLGGVQSNPRRKLCEEGIKLIQKEQVDFILAVGGGSVIDSAKCMAFGTFVANFWEFYMDASKCATIQKALPIGTVLTIPAAGSESSPGTVILDNNSGHKRSVKNDLLRPVFSVINPENAMTVPDFHLASGLVDIMGHAFERYFSNTLAVDYTAGLLEITIRTILEKGVRLMNDKTNYDLMAEVCLCGTYAHNGSLGVGRAEDWASHSIEHELSAKYDITHGSGLAIVYPAWMRYVSKENPEIFRRFAKTIFGLDGENAVEKAIIKLEEFYKQIGMPVRMSHLKLHPSDTEIEQMAQNAMVNRNKIGGLKKLGADDIAAILKLAR